MNLKNLFVSRDKNFARITEAGDYLGRRLRENLVIFDIDDANNNVTYVTESNHLISCDYKEVKGRLTLDNFVVEDLKKITSDEAIDNRVESEVHKFMESLVADRYDTAEVTFDRIVESFSMRAQIETSRKKLHKRLDRFNESYNIFDTKAYKKFNEALPLLKKFLEENVGNLSSNQKLVEGLRLSKVVGDTYDLPKLDINNLKEEFVVVPTNSKKTLYEMVCDKEVVRKELLEAKESFSRMWHHNDHISSLASHIYSKDSVVKSSLQEAVAGIPYLALANKVDLTSVLDSTFKVSNPGSIPQKDIREFVDKIYEFKKPLKVMVLEALNSKYGINVQSLRFVPSFKGLAEVQSEVLNMIAESCDEGILSDVLKEFSVCMSRKGGVQVLDISNTLSHIMAEAQFHIVDIDEDFHMKKLSDYLQQEAQYYGDDDAMSNSGGNAGEGEKDDSEDVKGKKKKGKKDKDWGGNKGDIKAKDRKEDDDSDLEADEKGDVDYDKADLPKNNKTKKGKTVKEGSEAVAEKEAPVEGEEQVPEPSEEDEDEEAQAAQDAQVEDSANNSEWRDLVASLEDVTKKIDLNFDEETEEEDEEDSEAGEGEEPTPQEDTPA